MSRCRAIERYDLITTIDWRKCLGSVHRVSINQREYDYFEQFYNVGRQWAAKHPNTLIQLCFGKRKNEAEFERHVQAAFNALGLAGTLSANPSIHSRYRSDVEFARRRFMSGARDVVNVLAGQHDLVKR